MLEKTIAWSLANRWLVIACATAVAIAGIVALYHIHVDAFPDTTPVQVQINAIAPALVPQEIEGQITVPIEREMVGMQGLESIRSVSQFGLCNVVLTFRDDIPIYFARQVIKEKLDGVPLPEDVRAELGPPATGLGEVFHYLLLPRGKDLTDIRTIQDWKIKPKLRSVRGTAEVNSWGGLKKQYQVLIDPNQLVRHELSFQEVVDALPRNNLNVGGGNLNQSGSMLLIHGVGRTSTLTEIENIVITAREGIPIRIKDVASVQIGHELRRGMVTANGQGEAVLGLGFMLMGENSYTVTNQLRSQFRQIQSSLDPGITSVAVYDRTRLVNEVLTTVKNNLCEGAFLVVFILFVMLGDLRVGLIAATSIPLAMLFGFCGMWYFGIAGSLLSLGAIDFGIVVDSSVVVLESIVRKLEQNPEADRKSRIALIQQATNEVRTPTVFGQIIILIVYIPILTLEGVEGKLFRPMALTVMCVLVGSLILSLTVTPVLASLFLSHPKHEGDAIPVKLAKGLYRPLLDLSIRFRTLLVGLSVVAVIGASLLATRMGTEFVPKLSEGDIVIGIARGPGTSFEQSVHVNSSIERQLLAAFPNEIENVWSRVGSPEVATDAGNIEATDMFVSLTPRHQWTKAHSQAELVKQMQSLIGDIPGQVIWFSQPIEQRINEMVSGVRADVALKIYGDDLKEVAIKAAEVESVLKTIPGAVDLSTEQIFGQPILQVKIIQDAIARYGVPAKSLLNLIEAISGKEYGTIREDPYLFPLVARLPEEIRNDIDRIGSMMVGGPGGEQIPLSRLAQVQIISGAKMISREGGERRITVQCNVRDRDVGSFVHEAQAAIAERVQLAPSQFRLEWGGQFENMRRAQRRLMLVVPIALLMIVIGLFASFRNFWESMLVFTGVPFACVGGVIALWMRGMPLSIAAAVGFITLSGVSVLNSMVLVSDIRQRIRMGTDCLGAVSASAMICLRTVLMTSLVASVGFVPMATSVAMGAEVQRPLATVVIGGVTSAAISSLFVLPGLYLLMFGRTRTSP